MGGVAYKWQSWCHKLKIIRWYPPLFSSSSLIHYTNWSLLVQIYSLPLRVCNAQYMRCVLYTQRQSGRRGGKGHCLFKFTPSTFAYAMHNICIVYCIHRGRGGAGGVNKNKQWPIYVVNEWHLKFWLITWRWRSGNIQ